MTSREQYEAFFNNADINGDKELTFEELSKTLRNSGYRGSDSQLKGFFRTCDLSGDGKISLDEYLEAMDCVPPKDHKAATFRRVFNEFDKDGSGKIDVNELKAVFKEMGKHFSEAELQRMIQLADKDNSGTLDEEEFIEYVFGN